MENPWVLCGVGFLFCVAGVYVFFKNAFEEDKKILKSVLLMIAGVVLIGLGMAKFYHVTI
jgi:uncharacterized membrane protein